MGACACLAHRHQNQWIVGLAHIWNVWGRPVIAVTDATMGMVKLPHLSVDGTSANSCW
jgi:hypothetical protein